MSLKLGHKEKGVADLHRLESVTYLSSFQNKLFTLVFFLVLFSSSAIVACLFLFDFHRRPFNSQTPSGSFSFCFCVLTLANCQDRLKEALAKADADRERLKLGTTRMEVACMFFYRLILFNF